MSDIMKLRAVWGNRPLLGVASGLLIQNEYGEVLMQRRGDNGLWSEPGGALESGEDFLTAARRELLEETGLECPNLTWLGLKDGLLSGPDMYMTYPNGHEIYIVNALFHGTLPAQALAHAQPDDSGETLELAWYSLAKLPPLSSNINRINLNVLRQRASLPALSLQPQSGQQPDPNYWADLSRALGGRPWFMPVSSVFVTDQSQRLLLLRHADSTKWTLPSSKMQLGESFEQTARRGLEQQTGLQARSLEHLHLLAGPAYRFSDQTGVWDRVEVLWHARGVSGELSFPADEIAGARWFAARELGEVDLLGLHTQRAVAFWQDCLTT